MVSYLMVLKTVQMSSPLQLPAHQNFIRGPLRTHPDSVVNPWQERKTHTIVKTLQCKSVNASFGSLEQITQQDVLYTR